MRLRTRSMRSWAASRAATAPRPEGRGTRSAAGEAKHRRPAAHYLTACGQLRSVGLASADTDYRLVVGALVGAGAAADPPSLVVPPKVEAPVVPDVLGLVDAPDEVVVPLLPDVVPLLVLLVPPVVCPLVVEPVPG